MSGLERLQVFDEWVDGRVGASPDAAWATILVAFQAVRAAVRQDARRLVRKMICWINQLRLQGNILIDMVTVAHFDRLPFAFRHEVTSK